MTLLLFFIFGTPYIALILVYTFGFLRLKNRPKYNRKQLSISVIVPFKDEVVNLPVLIESLSRQTHTNYDVILVADNVNAGWLDLLHKIIKRTRGIKIVESRGRGKKAALKTGLEYAKGEIIAYTDADCIVSQHWLSSIDKQFDETTNMVIGAVIMEPVHTFFQRMQALEYQSLMVSAAGSASLGFPTMCSGANLAVRKTVYKSLPNDVLKENISSGDDMFLMFGIQKYHKGSIRFMKETQALVTTPPTKDIKSFFQQRMRWTSKSPNYTNTYVIFTALIVLFANALLLFGMFINAKYTFVYYLIKISVEFQILYLSAQFFRGFLNLSTFLVTSIAYPFYIIYTAIGGLIMPLKWKENSVKK